MGIWAATSISVQIFAQYCKCLLLYQWPMIDHCSLGFAHCVCAHPQVFSDMKATIRVRLSLNENKVIFNFLNNVIIAHIKSQTFYLVIQHPIDFI